MLCMIYNDNILYLFFICRSEGSLNFDVSIVTLSELMAVGK